MEPGSLWDQFLNTELKGRPVLISEPLIAQSFPGATNDAFKNYDTIAPICILITWMNIEVPAGIALFTIVDNLGRVMFQNTGNAALSGHYPINWYVRGSTLKITCSNPIVRFSVGHHYLTVTDRKK